jgi:hypothetical protein
MFRQLRTSLSLRPTLIFRIIGVWCLAQSTAVAQISDSADTEFSNEVMLPQICTLPASSAVTRSEGFRIYSWRNQDGRLTYSDRPPNDSSISANVSTGPSRMQYFSLNLDYRGRDSATNLRNQIDLHTTAIYRILSGLVGDDRLRKVDLNIVVLPDETAYVEFASAFAERDMSSTRGFYSTRSHQAVTFVQPTPEWTLEVIRHEASHVISTGILGITPLWLNEGLAVYFSKLSINGQSISTDVHEPALQLARETIQAGYPRTLEDLLDMTDETWRNADMENHYALAWSLVFFLMSSAEGKLTVSNLLQALSDNYCQTIDTTALLQNAYPGGVQALQSGFIRWLLDSNPKRPHTH